MKTLGAAGIIAVGLVVAGLLAGGRYDARAVSGAVFRLDRFTGEVDVCGAASCHEIMAAGGAATWPNVPFPQQPTASTQNVAPAGPPIGQSK